MSDTRLNPLICGALVGLVLLPLAGCEGERFEPRLPTGVSISESEPPALEVHALAGHSLDDLVVVGNLCAIAGHDADGWTFLGPEWPGSLRLVAVTTSAGGDVAVCDEDGRVFERRAGAWSELPALDGVRLADVAFDHDGSIWVCGRSQLWLPLLAHWDGAAWHLHQPPYDNTGLYRIAVVGPGDLVIDGSRGVAFRFRAGDWEQIAFFTEINDLWTDGQGEVYAAWLHRVGRLAADGFEPLDDREFPNDLRCIAGNDQGDLAVGWYPGGVAVRHDGLWEDLPPIPSVDGSTPTPDRLILCGDGTLIVLAFWGQMFRYDGAAWASFAPSSPPLRALVLDRVSSYDLIAEYDVIGAEGTVYAIDDREPRYRGVGTVGERLDLIDRVRLANGSYFHITASGRWMVRIGDDRSGSAEPAPHAYRAAAAGPDGEVVVVGDAGQVQWGVNGIQFTDGPGVIADLHDIWSCEADSTYWTVGDGGTIARRAPDRSWTLHSDVTATDLTAVWARDDRDLYVAGAQGTVLAWNGTQWRDLQCPLVQDLTAIMGSPGRYLWVCGRAGTLAMHDGDRWRVLDSGYGGDLLGIGLQTYRQAAVLADDGSLLGCTVLDP